MLNLKKNGVSIIIPTYNEKETIIATLDNVKKYVKTPKEVIVVDDSTDKTGEIVKKYVKDNQWVVYVKNKKFNKGFVKSLWLGVKKSKKDVVVFMMADKCDDPKTVDKMYKKISKGWDVVCGSRYVLKGKRIGGPELFGFLSKYLCLFSYYFIKIPTHDVTNSFKMYRKNVLQKLKFNFTSETAISMELLLQAYFKRFKITEVPTVWKGRLDTKFKLNQRGPKYFKILFWGMKNRLRKDLRLALKKFYC